MSSIERRGSIGFQDVVKMVNIEIPQKGGLRPAIIAVASNILNNRSLRTIEALNVEVQRISPNPFDHTYLVLVETFKELLPNYIPLKKEMAAGIELDDLFNSKQFDKVLLKLKSLTMLQYKLPLFEAFGREFAKIGDFARAEELLKDMSESPEMRNSKEKVSLERTIRSLHTHLPAHFSEFVAIFRKELESSRKLTHALQYINFIICKIDSLDQIDALEKEFRASTKTLASEELVFAESRAEGKKIVFDDLTYEGLTWLMFESVTNATRQDLIKECLKEDKIDEALAHMNKMNPQSKITIQSRAEVIEYLFEKGKKTEARQQFELLPDCSTKDKFATHYFKDLVMHCYEAYRNNVPLQLRAVIPTNTEVRRTFDDEMQASMKRAEQLAQLSLNELETQRNFAELVLQSKKEKMSSALQSGQTILIKKTVDDFTEASKTLISINFMIESKKQQLQSEPQQQVLTVEPIQSPVPLPKQTTPAQPKAATPPQPKQASQPKQGSNTNNNCVIS